jgi:hypothetical protein
MHHYNITFGSSGDSSYVHVYPFPFIDDNTKTDKKRFYSIVAEQKANMLGIQCTLTTEQIERFPHYLDWLKENEFRIIYTHTNPNTNRVIVTFWCDPPAILEKPKGIPSNFIEKHRASNVGFSQHLCLHGGGCCGWLSVEQFEHTKGTRKQIDIITKILGEIEYYYPEKNIATQFCIETSLTHKEDVNTGIKLQSVLFAAKFRLKFTFASGLTGKNMSFFIRHKTEQKLPIFKYPD